MAKTFGVRIYTIGAGTHGTALYPIDDPIFGKRYVSMPVEIDEASLQKIAELTDGRYFRATDEQKLAEIYSEIGQLEKTKIQVKEFTRYHELYIYFLAVGLFGLMSETILSQTWFRKIP
jgi:Ca-activated chloride channel family protein